jgi:tetratricopeptide (TPR) repeat protein
MDSRDGSTSSSPTRLVAHFLRGQNLEQLGKLDEAIELYEEAVTAGFDSSGPYDRLIAIYGRRASHRQVIRVAEAAIANVHTHKNKRESYERTRAEARKALARVPLAVPKAAPKRPS